MLAQHRCVQPATNLTWLYFAQSNIFHHKVPILTFQLMFATVCGVEWNVNAADFTPPQNGATVRTDSVRTNGYLQNFETPIIN